MPADFTANTALVRRCQQGDPAAAEALLSLNEPLVYTIAARYHRDGGPCELADLLQEGRLGLLRAAQKFDPARGVSFSTYAHFWIRAAISRAARSSALVRVPIYAQGEQSRPAPVSLDTPIGAESGTTLGDVLPDPFDLEAAVTTRIAARQWLAELKPRERLVLERRFGLDDSEPQTLAAIGQALHLHPERVRQLQCRALARLKEAAG